MRQQLAVASCLLLCLGGAPVAQAAKPLRTATFTRAVFRMEDGVVWGHISGGADCNTDYEQLRWGREGSEIKGQRLGDAFQQAMASVAGGAADDNLFDEAAAPTDLQVAAAISDMRVDACERRALAGFRGTLSMSVQWQVYDPAQRRLVGRFDTHASGQASRNTLDGVEDLFAAAFRANARDLMSDPGFQRLLNAPPTGAGPSVAPKDVRAGAGLIRYTPARNTAAALRPAQAVPSVVLVSTSEGHGSGFLISADGYVLTNDHVVGAARSVRIRWPDGAEGPGQVIRTDRSRDVALIKVEAAARAPLPIHPLLPAQGDTVFAIGAPLEPGLQGTLTRGIVSANRVRDGQPFIQSDVAMTFGNSGGPLLNERGEVVGMADAIIPQNGVPVGLNLFIPIGDALRALQLEPSEPSPGVPVRRARH